MPYAVTHVLIVLILLELFRDYFVSNKKAFPLHYVMIGGVAGILPDLDMLVYYAMYFLDYPVIAIHRTFSHNLFVPLAFLLLAIPFYRFKNKRLGEHHLKLRNILLVIAFGVFMHLMLDSIISGHIMPFYPISGLEIGLNLLGYAPQGMQGQLEASIDAALLVMWLIYIEARHKISSFI